MKVNNKNSDIHTKPMIQKEKVYFKEFGQFFLFLAIYFLVSGILLSLFRTYISKKELQIGGALRYIFISTMEEFGCRLAVLAFIMGLIFVFRKKIKCKNQAVSLQLFDIMSFVLLFCEGVLPVAVTAIYGAYESAADLFVIVTVVLHMLLCRIFADSRFLKHMSYVYMAIPMIVLSVFGMIGWYYQRTDLVNVPRGFALLFGYIKGFFYIVYPTIGYVLLSFYMRKKEETSSDN